MSSLRDTKMKEVNVLCLDKKVVTIGYDLMKQCKMLERLVRDSESSEKENTISHFITLPQVESKSMELIVDYFLTRSKEKGSLSQQLYGDWHDSFFKNMNDDTLIKLSIAASYLEASALDFACAKALGRRIASMPLASDEQKTIVNAYNDLLLSKPPQSAAQVKKENLNSNETRCAADQKKIMKDIRELTLPTNCEIIFDDDNDLFIFKVAIHPAEGYYSGGRFVFMIKIGPNYPVEPPVIKCKTVIYHPNIDLEGQVYLDILQDSWNPNITLTAIICSLLMLLLEPSFVDAVNPYAGEDFATNLTLFEENVSHVMNVGFVEPMFFAPCKFWKECGEYSKTR